MEKQHKVVQTKKSGLCSLILPWSRFSRDLQMETNWTEKKNVVALRRWRWSLRRARSTCTHKMVTGQYKHRRQRTLLWWQDYDLNLWRGKHKWICLTCCFNLFSSSDAAWPWEQGALLHKRSDWPIDNLLRWATGGGAGGIDDHVGGGHGLHIVQAFNGRERKGVVVVVQSGETSAENNESMPLGVKFNNNRSGQRSHQGCCFLEI